MYTSDARLLISLVIVLMIITIFNMYYIKQSVAEVPALRNADEMRSAKIHGTSTVPRPLQDQDLNTTTAKLEKMASNDSNDYPFRNILNNKGKCHSSSTLKIIFIVASAANHFDARMTVRQTWGTASFRKDVRIVFILGSTGDSTKQQMIEREGELYGDIVQEDFVDTYRNLTLKSIALLRWANSFCKNAEFVAKVDDDTFVHIPNLLEFLATRNTTKRVIYGRTFSDKGPYRDKNCKYYVSEEDYPGNLFPKFVQGHLYIMSTDSVQDLLDAAKSLKILPMEDVFITGICAEHANISRIGDERFLANIEKGNPCNFRNILSVDDMYRLSMYDIWNYVNNPSFRSCDLVQNTTTFAPLQNWSTIS